MSFVNFYLYVAGLFVFGAQHEPIMHAIFNQLKVSFTMRACMHSMEIDQLNVHLIFTLSKETCNHALGGTDYILHIIEQF